MFIDRVGVRVKTGKGGDGIVAFRREEYVAYGGPSGGDDGAGDDIVFMVDEGKTTLLDLRCNRKMAAEPDRNGKTRKIHGADGADCIIEVPQSTLVKDEKAGRIPVDLTRKGQKEITAKGEKGGRGSFRFKPSKNTAPQYSELDTPEGERDVMVELKVLADVELIGFPSVGKSTLLSVVPKAKPEVVEYHFTTLAPNLGMVQILDGRNFIIVDLPGLVKGVSKGEGLGHQFLHHIERCHIIIHVVDMRANDDRDPVADYKVINDELKQHEYHLMERPQTVLANEMNLDRTQKNLKRFRKVYPEVEVFKTTAVIAEGLKPVLYRAADPLGAAPQFPLYNNDASNEGAEGVPYKFGPEQPASKVHDMGNGNRELSGEELERSFKMNKMDNEGDFMQFARKMREMGVDEALRKAGCKGGDVIAICDAQFRLIE